MPNPVRAMFWGLRKQGYSAAEAEKRTREYFSAKKARKSDKKMPQRRMGKPRTDAERRARHMAIYGTEKLPPRGTGLRRRG
jgi:hypothetical protein